MTFIEAIDEMKNGKIMKVSGNGNNLCKLVDGIIHQMEYGYDKEWIVKEIIDVEIESDLWEIHTDKLLCPCCKKEM